MAAPPRVQARPRRWLAPITLVVLEEESSHGYELMRRMEEEFGFEQIDPGSVYRTLRQTEHEGLCRSEWETPAPEGGPPRRMYSITEAGEAHLEAWQKRVSRSAQAVSAAHRRVRSGLPKKTLEPFGVAAVAGASLG